MASLDSHSGQTGSRERVRFARKRLLLEAQQSTLQQLGCVLTCLSSLGFPVEANVSHTHIVPAETDSRRGWMHELATEGKGKARAAVILLVLRDPR